jgi:hypothetical protein
VPDAAPFGGTVERNEIADVVGAVAGPGPVCSSPCAGAAGVATGADALSVVAVRRLRELSWRGPGGSCRVPRTACRTVSPGAFAAGGGVSCSFFPAQPGGQRSFCAEPRLLCCAVRRWLPPVAWLWRGCCAPPRCCFPRTRSILHHTGAGAAARQHRQQAPAVSPKKKSHTGNPVQTRCRRCPCRAESRGWFPWRPLPCGCACRTDASPAPPQPLVPWAVGFVQNPSSACPAIRPQSETKHCGANEDQSVNHATSALRNAI